MRPNPIRLTTNSPTRDEVETAVVGNQGWKQTGGLLKRRAWVLVVAALVIGCGQPPVMAESKDVSLEGWSSDDGLLFHWIFQTRCFVTICC